MNNDLNPLTKEQIEERLEEIPEWQYKDDKIFKEFEFASFLETLSFINELAPFFEENDHHPDMHISYKKVLFEITRFSIGGKVTERDFMIAKKIEDNFNNLK